MSQVGQRGAARDSVTVCRMTCNIKRVNCFWNFPACKTEALESACSYFGNLLSSIQLVANHEILA